MSAESENNTEELPEDAPRALITNREIAVLRKGKDHPDISPNHYRVTRSRVRDRSQRLLDEFDVIEEYVPDAAEAIKDGVCDD